MWKFQECDGRGIYNYRNLDEVRAVQDDPSKESFCANTLWRTGGFRDRVNELVGWDATNPQLQGEAYDTVLHTIYEVLPPCRNCGCL